ncbi:MAG: efflux RND transporter periplasmic adaptor subunit [Nitrospirae bacterium]|nr:efflux RND transporter periplasmic adaptor subunit [Candidatus Manganitrophaceae bacterium]
MKRNDLVILSVFLGALLLLFLLSSCGRTPASTAAGEELPVEEKKPPKLTESAAKGVMIREVVSRPGRMEILVSGKIQYKEDRVSKVSSPVSGRASRIVAKLGDRVSEGAPLIVIESPDAVSAYSDFLRARSDLAFSERGFHLAEDLFETKAISQKDLQQAKNDYLKAQTELNRAKSRLVMFSLDPERIAESGNPSAQALFELKAPISGVIVEKNITRGQAVGTDPAQILFTVADLSTVDFVGQIFEKDVARIALNAEVAVTVDAYPNERFIGKVRYIGDQVDPATRTIQVRGEVPNPGGRLKPEMFARIAVQAASAEKIVTVPFSAVVEEGGKSYVFRVAADQTFDRKAVTLGPQWGSEVQILEGLKSGDRVVINGVLLLKAAFDAGS